MPSYSSALGTAYSGEPALVNDTGVVNPPPPPPPSPPPAPVGCYYDHFGRTVSSWTTADSGQVWGPTLGEYGEPNIVYALSVNGSEGIVTYTHTASSGQVDLQLPIIVRSATATVKVKYRTPTVTFDPNTTDIDPWMQFSFYGFSADNAAADSPFTITNQGIARLQLRGNPYNFPSPDTGDAWLDWRDPLNPFNNQSSPVHATPQIDRDGWFWIKLEVLPTSISAKVWKDGSAEPGTWLLTLNSGITNDIFTNWDMAGLARGVDDIEYRYDDLVIVCGTDGPVRVTESFSRANSNGATSSAIAWGPSEFPGSPVWVADGSNIGFHGTEMFSVVGGKGVINTPEWQYPGNSDPIAAVRIGPMALPIDVTGELTLSSSQANPDVEVPFLYLLGDIPMSGSNWTTFPYQMGAEFLNDASFSELGVFGSFSGTNVTNYVAGNMSSGNVNSPMSSVTSLKWRVRVDSAGVHARVWDAAGGEPGAWQSQYLGTYSGPTLTTIACSAFQFGTSGTGTASFDNIVVTYGP